MPGVLRATVPYRQPHHSDRDCPMQTFRRLLATALVFAITAGTAFAFASRPPEVYGQKHYGIIVEMPNGRIGIWNITGERVEVTKETTIDEKLGKAEPGAFVEATGKKQWSIFKASRIVVKLPDNKP